MPHSLRVGTRPTCQPCWSARHSWATRKVSCHTHDSKEIVRPSISSEVILVNQRRGATQHVGHKLFKELLSLTPFFFAFHVPHCYFCKYTHCSKVPRYRRTSLVVSLNSGATRIRLASISQSQIFSYVSFFQKVWTSAATVCQGLLKSLGPQCSARPINTKRRDHRRRLYLDLPKNLFHLSWFSPTYIRGKE
jgi:hypothetical protein